MGPHDGAILEHLTDVRVVAAPASAGDGAASRPPGYRVELRFDSAENPFFTDESLWASVECVQDARASFAPSVSARVLILAPPRARLDTPTSPGFKPRRRGSRDHGEWRRVDEPRPRAVDF